MGIDPIPKEEIHNLMNIIVELISKQLIRGTMIEIDGVTKAKISTSAKGKLILRGLKL
ncbi:hypothetical protein SAMN05660297_02765 [Natronincola peptidivorans]|uniref:Uncharacterized protein n=1 Tax=Natronincola peptidivorans TaxID=426128 RepID=A0A1I0FFH7_9FIRM|nr:hypothetical protein [Natronincola peptidivorans]SET55964.1 hypothetical protein SAMN05660297_02765 [Natronincola peptidivorans]